MDRCIINGVIKKIKDDLVSGNQAGLEKLLFEVYKGEANVCDLVDYADITVEFEFKKQK